MSFRYEDGVPAAIEAVVLSTQHAEGIGLDELREAVRREIIDPVIPAALRGAQLPRLHQPHRAASSPAGRRATPGSPGARSSSTPTAGRRPTAAAPSPARILPRWIARLPTWRGFLAKTVVARGWAKRCLVQLSYAIGVAEPVSFLVETFGTGEAPGEEIARTALDRNSTSRRAGSSSG